jgi:hypothetical protein
VATQANGGLANYGGAMSLIDSTVSGNTAGVAAGGIGNYLGGTMTLTDSAVVGNSASNAGGILNTARLTLVDSMVVDNAIGGGSGLFTTSVALNMTSSTPSDNPILNDASIVATGAVTPTDDTVSSIAISQENSQVETAALTILGNAIPAYSADAGKANPTVSPRVDADSDDTTGDDTGVTNVPTLTVRNVSGDSIDPRDRRSVADAQHFVGGTDALALAADVASRPSAGDAREEMGQSHSRSGETALPEDPTQERTEPTLRTELTSESVGAEWLRSMNCDGLLDNVPGSQTALTTGIWVGLMLLTHDAVQTVQESDDRINVERNNSRHRHEKNGGTGRKMY